jgi:hypothetical protein
LRISPVLGGAALILAVPANAALKQASSKHFLIYGDMPAEEMQAYATKLEKFDAAARLVRSMDDPVVGDGNRVHVYVVPTALDVRRTMGSASSTVLDYYEDDVRSPFIITPRKTRLNVDNRQIDPETVFFHEVHPPFAVYAAALAPRDLKLQVRLGLEYLRQNRLPEAKEALGPVGYLPHAVGEAKYAKQAIDMIGAGNGAGAVTLHEREVILKDDKDDPA